MQGATPAPHGGRLYALWYYRFAERRCSGNQWKMDLMSDPNHDPGESVSIRPREDVRLPPQFRVLLHNDHYTTMEFVVEVLSGIFGKSDQESVRIMLNVHQKGVGTAGVYTSAVAETKVATVHALAEENEFPLRCSMEPE